MTPEERQKAVEEFEKNLQEALTKARQDPSYRMIEVPFALAVLAVLLFTHGLVLSIMWGWFVVPYGLPVITVGQAIGISLVGRQILGMSEVQREQRSPLTAILLPWFTLGLGFVVKLVFGL